MLLGAHLLTANDAALVPSSAVIYNLEQVQLSSGWCSPDYLGLLKRCQVWDYAKRNIASLGKLALARPAVHVPIGYVPQLTRIPRNPVQDIDVLFYGSVNERRARVLDQLRSRGINTQAVFGVYGAARDSLIARAKVVLNLHFYEASIFEIVRVSYLLANRKAVVAECHDGTEIDRHARCRTPGAVPATGGRLRRTGQRPTRAVGLGRACFFPRLGPVRRRVPDRSTS